MEEGHRFTEAGAKDIGKEAVPGMDQVRVGLDNVEGILPGFFEQPGVGNDVRNPEFGNPALAGAKEVPRTP